MMKEDWYDLDLGPLTKILCARLSASSSSAAPSGSSVEKHQHDVFRIAQTNGYVRNSQAAREDWESLVQSKFPTPGGDLNQEAGLLDIFVRPGSDDAFEAAVDAIREKSTRLPWCTTHCYEDGQGKMKHEHTGRAENDDGNAKVDGCHTRRLKAAGYALWLQKQFKLKFDFFNGAYLYDDEEDADIEESDAPTYVPAKKKSQNIDFKKSKFSKDWAGLSDFGDECIKEIIDGLKKAGCKKLPLPDQMKKFRSVVVFHVLCVSASDPEMLGGSKHAERVLNLANSMLDKDLISPLLMRAVRDAPRCDPLYRNRASHFAQVIWSEIKRLTSDPDVQCGLAIMINYMYRWMGTVGFSQLIILPSLRAGKLEAQRESKEFDVCHFYDAACSSIRHYAGAIEMVSCLAESNDGRRRFDRLEEVEEKVTEPTPSKVCNQLLAHMRDWMQSPQTAKCTDAMKNLMDTIRSYTKQVCSQPDILTTDDIIKSFDAFIWPLLQTPWIGKKGPFHRHSHEALSDPELRGSFMRSYQLKFVLDGFQQLLRAEFCEGPINNGGAQGGVSQHDASSCSRCQRASEKDGSKGTCRFCGCKSCRAMNVLDQVRISWGPAPVISEMEICGDDDHTNCDLFWSTICKTLNKIMEIDFPLYHYQMLACEWRSILLLEEKIQKQISEFRKLPQKLQRKMLDVPEGHFFTKPSDSKIISCLDKNGKIGKDSPNRKQRQQLFSRQIATYKLVLKNCGADYCYRSLLGQVCSFVLGSLTGSSQEKTIWKCSGQGKCKRQKHLTQSWLVTAASMKKIYMSGLKEASESAESRVARWNDCCGKLAIAGPWPADTDRAAHKKRARNAFLDFWKDSSPLDARFQAYNNFAAALGQIQAEPKQDDKEDAHDWFWDQVCC